jgi:hypothetical protein
VEPRARFYLVQQGSTALVHRLDSNSPHHGNCTLDAGAYSSPIRVMRITCIKVVFPLANGSCNVIHAADMQEAGSLVLRSEGKRFVTRASILCAQGTRGG